VKKGTISKAIIPAAGLGTRLLPATKSQPKEMLPVGRKPILQFVVEELLSADINQLLIITGRRKRTIEDHFDSDPQLISALKTAGNEQRLAELTYIEGKSRLYYTRQSKPKGLGHAVSLGADFVDNEHFVVALGDSLIAADDPSASIRGMIDAHQDLKAAATIAVENVPPEDVSHYGIVGVNDIVPTPGEPLTMTGVVEKPQPNTAPSTLAIAARYIFGPAIFEALGRTSPDMGGEIQLTDAIQIMIQMGHPVYAWLLPEGHQRYDVGNFESYFRSFIDFALADERYGYMVRKYIKAKAYEL
jgi:UTP--glucose-1-phosphate uridylyltransferase